MCFGWRMERYLTTLIPPWMIMLKQPKKTAPKPYQLQPDQIINKLIQVFCVFFYCPTPDPITPRKNLNLKDLKSMEGGRVAAERRSGFLQCSMFVKILFTIKHICLKLKAFLCNNRQRFENWEM